MGREPLRRSRQGLPAALRARCRRLGLELFQGTLRRVRGHYLGSERRRVARQVGGVAVAADRHVRTRLLLCPSLDFDGAAHRRPLRGGRAGIPLRTPPVGGVFVGHRVEDDVDLSVVIIPMAVIVAAFAVLPLLAFVRRVRRIRGLQRVAAGCCAACGYDLRASPGRCPECGRPSHPPAAAKRNLPLTS
jgi:hypothetical protein